MRRAFDEAIMAFGGTFLLQDGVDVDTKVEEGLRARRGGARDDGQDWVEGGYVRPMGRQARYRLGPYRSLPQDNRPPGRKRHRKRLALAGRGSNGQA